MLRRMPSRTAWARALEVFEIDHPVTSQDKRQRLQRAGIECPDNLHFVTADFNEQGWQNNLTALPYFDRSNATFCTLLGISYYLAKQAFAEMVGAIAGIIPEGSSVAFDYPDENIFTDSAGVRAKKQAMMAGAANERMLAGYHHAEMERLLLGSGFFVREHLIPDEITGRFFKDYNLACPEHRITAFDNVNYCLAARS